MQSKSENVDRGNFNQKSNEEVFGEAAFATRRVSLFVFRPSRATNGNVRRLTGNRSRSVPLGSPVYETVERDYC